MNWLTKRKHWSQVYTHHLPNKTKSQLWFRPYGAREKKKKEMQTKRTNNGKKSARIVILSGIKYFLFAPWFINVYCNIFSFSLWLFYNVGCFLFSNNKFYIFAFHSFVKVFIVSCLNDSIQNRNQHQNHNQLSQNAIKLYIAFTRNSIVLCEKSTQRANEINKWVG